MGLEEVAGRVKECRKCPLFRNRTQAVPGEGLEDARVLFIGEAPGREEDLSGKPFVGRAGKLLTKLLEDAGLKRNRVFITSVIKCRPPGNRLPKRDETNACYPYLNEQIRILKPDIIVLLGNTAIKTVVGLNGITKLHGKVIIKEKENYLPMFHPAAGVRNRKLIPLMKEDMEGLSRHLIKLGAC